MSKTKNARVTDLTIEAQYKEYLKKSGLNERTMSKNEKIERKRAFFAGAGIVLMLVKEACCQLEEKEAIGVLESLEQEAVDFFNS